MAVPDYIDSIILTQIKNLSIFERILSVEDICVLVQSKLE